MGAWGVTSPWLISTWHLLTVLPPNLTLQTGKGRMWGGCICVHLKTQKWRALMLLSISHRSFVPVFPFANWEEECNAHLQILGGQSWSVPEPVLSKPYCFLHWTYTTFPPLLRNKHLLLLRAKGQVKGRAMAITLHLLRLRVQLLWAFQHRSCGLLPFGNCLLVVLFI